MIARAPNVDCHVKILTGPDRGHVLPLAASSLLIGRDSDCDLLLDSSFVSRRHALLESRGDGDYLTDLKSANGTKVNGRHLRGERRLDDGDVIHISSLPCCIAVVYPIRRNG